MNYKLSPWQEQILDYRKILQDRANEFKTRRPSFTYAQLAESMRVHSPYLSKVFRREAHINGDQLFLACEALELNAEDCDSLQLSLEWSRCEVPARKKALRARLQEIEHRRQNSRQHLKAAFVEPARNANYQKYYLDPVTPLVHIGLTIPIYQRETHRLAALLGVGHKKFAVILQTLEELALVRFDAKQKRYVADKDHLHLDRDHILNQTYQQLFRHVSLEHTQRLAEDEKFRFAVTFSADEDTRRKIHDEFNAFLRRIEPLVREAPAEGLYQVLFDLFRWDAGHD